VLDRLKRECVRGSFFRPQTAATLSALLRTPKTRDYRVVHVVAAHRQGIECARALNDCVNTVSFPPQRP
jgi:hypothetical protein